MLCYGKTWWEYHENEFHINSLCTLRLCIVCNAHPPLWPIHPFADRAATYFLTKTMLELPVTLVQTLVQFIMCYNMIGLQVLLCRYISEDILCSHCNHEFSLYFLQELNQYFAHCHFAYPPHIHFSWSSREISCTSFWRLGDWGAPPAQ